MPFSFENCIDDWVLLCAFVGNDFLPRLPSLSIVDGALDDLMEQYCQHLADVGGYLTCNGDVHMGRVVSMLRLLGRGEEKRLSQREVLRGMGHATVLHASVTWAA